MLQPRAPDPPLDLLEEARGSVAGAPALRRRAAVMAPIYGAGAGSNNGPGAVARG